jgi:uncharacterized protein YdaU (DUF1376 family)
MKREIKLDAWMPLYVGDWDAGTRHLTCEQDGAYGRLVRWYWCNGPLPDDGKVLAQIVGMSPHKWRANEKILCGFFSKKDGKLFHDRVERELHEWTEKKRVFMERAASGGRAKAAKSAHKAVLNGCTSASPGREEKPSRVFSSPSDAPATPSPAEGQATPAQDTPFTPQEIAYFEEQGIAYD